MCMCAPCPNNLREITYLPAYLLLNLAGSKTDFRKTQKQKPITKTQRQAW